MFQAPDLESNEKKLKNQEKLDEILSRVRHLDLSGKLEDVEDAKCQHGGYSDIFVGWIDSTHLRKPFSPGRVKVAKKCLRAHLKGDFALALAKEIYIWSKLDHKNILPLLGYITEGPYPSLISEWCNFGTLIHYLNENTDSNILSMALGIAEGLEYLHSQSIVHSDMKSDNVLISSGGEPLICDFGISRLMSSTQSFGATSSISGIRGTCRWMAIELLRFDEDNPDVKHTLQSDVWAFGMTMFEIISLKRPYFEVKMDLQVYSKIMQGVLPQEPEGIQEDLHKLVLWNICELCWKSDPVSRPRITEIISLLLGIEISDVGQVVSPLEDTIDEDINTGISRKYPSKKTVMARRVSYRQASLKGIDASFRVRRHKKTEFYLPPSPPPQLSDGNISVMAVYKGHGKEKDSILLSDMAPDNDYMDDINAPREVESLSTLNLRLHNRNMDENSNLIESPIDKSLMLKDRIERWIANNKSVIDYADPSKAQHVESVKSKFGDLLKRFHIIS